MTESSREQREHPRRSVELPAVVTEPGSGVDAQLLFDTGDLSLGGAFLRSELLLEEGEELQVRLALPEQAEITARARVVHVIHEPGERGAGMGLVFTLLGDEDRERIRAYLAARS